MTKPNKKRSAKVVRAWSILTGGKIISGKFPMGCPSYEIYDREMTGKDLDVNEMCREVEIRLVPISASKRARGRR